MGNRVTEILQSAGLIDFSMVNEDVMRRAQAFGTAVHVATELWDKGVLDIETVDPELIPYLNGWKQFVEDYKITINPGEMEKRFESKKYGFSGTPDRWPEIAGKITVIDIKSSSSMYVATAIQTMLYQILLEEHGIKPKQRWGVQLLGEPTPGKKLYRVEPYTDSSDRSVALSCVNLHHFKTRKGLIK